MTGVNGITPFIKTYFYAFTSKKNSLKKSVEITDLSNTSFHIAKVDVRQSDSAILLGGQRKTPINGEKHSLSALFKKVLSNASFLLTNKSLVSFLIITILRV